MKWKFYKWYEWNCIAILSIGIQCIGNYFYLFHNLGIVVAILFVISVLMDCTNKLVENFLFQKRNLGDFFEKNETAK